MCARVTVCVHAADGRDHEVEVPPDFSMLTMKVSISDTTGIAPDEQRLVHCGAVLAEDGALLADVLACRSDAMHLIPRSAKPARAVEDAARRSMFALGHDPVCDAQHPGSIFADLFNDFVADSACCPRF